MQGAQKLRSEAHLQVRRNDEVDAQRGRWTFYETINFYCNDTTRKKHVFINPHPIPLPNWEREPVIYRPFSPSPEAGEGRGEGSDFPLLPGLGMLQGMHEIIFFKYKSSPIT